MELVKESLETIAQFFRSFPVQKPFTVGLVLPVHQHIVSVVYDTSIVIILSVGGGVVLVDRRPWHRNGQLGVLVIQILFQVLHQVRELLTFRIITADRLMEIQMQTVHVVLGDLLGELLEPTGSVLAVAQTVGRVGLWGEKG